MTGQLFEGIGGKRMVKVGGPDKCFREIKSLLKRHQRWRRDCLNLIASENVTSPSVRGAVSCDFMHRYAEWEDHRIDKRWGNGVKFIVEVEKILDNLFKKLFGANYSEFRPISGQVAMLAAICAFTQPSGRIFTIDKRDGGPWYRGNNLIRYRLLHYQFDPEEWNIEVDASTKMIRRTKPDMLVLGSSFYLFPHPVRELREVADEIGAPIVCDESHVLGLILGRRWPNPLNLGARVLLGSTHKTLPGPQKGIILMNEEEVALRIAEALYPSIIDNHHLANSAALALALTELEKFGEAYADQTVKNAKALGEALSEEGFTLIGEHKGFTDSHQVLVRLSDLKGREAAEMLEAANVIVSKMELRCANGIRIGVSEVTRRGLKEAEMEDIAVFIRKVLIERKQPRKIAKEVGDFMRGFRGLHYTFDRGRDAY